MKKLVPILILLLMSVACVKAQSVTRYLLDSVDSGDGYWPCMYYELNYNSDIADAEAAGWASLDEDESYWREGIGPFSIDENKFMVTQWQSSLHPILIRRHFILTAEDMQYLGDATIALTSSYDENPKFYLNGKSIISYNGWNDNNYAKYTFPKSRKAYLVEGDNVLAVSVMQGAGGGHIDFGLTMKYTPVENGIVEMAAEEASAVMYNLAGQRVTESHKGIIVAGGKKIMNNKY